MHTYLSGFYYIERISYKEHQKNIQTLSSYLAIISTAETLSSVRTKHSTIAFPSSPVILHIRFGEEANQRSSHQIGFGLILHVLTADNVLKASSLAGSKLNFFKICTTCDPFK